MGVLTDKGIVDEVNRTIGRRQCDGDDEVIKINLQKVPTDVHKIVITVTIHEAAGRHQNFGQVQNAFIRVVNAQNEKETLHVIQ